MRETTILVREIEFVFARKQRQPDTGRINRENGFISEGLETAKVHRFAASRCKVKDFAEVEQNGGNALVDALRNTLLGPLRRQRSKLVEQNIRRTVGSNAYRLNKETLEKRIMGCQRVFCLNGTWDYPYCFMYFEPMRLLMSLITWMIYQFVSPERVPVKVRV